MTPRMTWRDKVDVMMRRSGKSFRQCCIALGSRGGHVSAAKKRRIAERRRKEEAMGLA